MQQEDTKSSDDLREEADRDRKNASDLEGAANEVEEGEEATKAAAENKSERGAD